ncbi:MAG: hypothetical protein ACK4UO_13000 [Pseudolabrys sp.]
MKNSLITLAVTMLCFTAAFAGAFIALHSQPAPNRLGSTDTNVLPFTPAVSNVWVTTADTLVVSSSSGRVRLEVFNVSGGTTSPSQAIYCNVGDRPSTAYSGFVIHASSSKIFGLDDLMRGALRCRFPAGGGSVAVIDY